MFLSVNSRVKVATIKFFNDSKGITAIEYALIGVAMATALAIILGAKDGSQAGTFTHAIKGSFDSIVSSITQFFSDKN